MSMTIMVQVDMCYPETTGHYKPVCELDQTQIGVQILTIRHTSQKLSIYVTLSMTIMVQVDMCYPETTGHCKPVGELKQTQIGVRILKSDIPVKSYQFRLPCQ